MNESVDQLSLAKNLASKAHCGQFRRDGETPYINHPASVAKRCKMQADGEVYQAVAWLHDSIEDSHLTSEDLLRFGVKLGIINAVVAITKVDGEDYEKYLDRVKANPLARVVKIQDMLDNLASSPTDKQILRYAKGLQFLLS